MHTRSAQQIVMNSIWFVLRSRILFCFTPCVCRMDASLLNSTWLTRQTLVTMPSTNVFGYNTVIATLPHLIRWMRTWSRHLTHQRTVRHAITLSLYKVGWISLTATRISMAHLTLLSYVAARLVIPLDRIPRAHLLLKLWISQNEFPGLIFPHIPFMWTVAFIQSSLEWLWHCRAIMLCIHYIHHRPSGTKGSLMTPPPIFFFLFFNQAKMPYTSTWIAARPPLNFMRWGM